MVKLEDLKNAVEDLNNSGLLKENLVLKEDEDYVSAFMKAAEEADDLSDVVGKSLPDSVVDAYELCKQEIKNRIMRMSKSKKEAVTETRKEEEPKMKKVSKKEKSRYGHRMGTFAAMLDDLFFKGTTLEEALKVTGANGYNFRTHLYRLRKSGIKIVKDDQGIYKVVS
jgi:hypothetical protein